MIVLDQFEQWLYSNQSDNSQLVQALRQCDGRNIMCIIVVRDDFWLATSRFFEQLELRIIDGTNAMFTSLFNKTHAIRVLTGFGRAHRILPKAPALLTDKSMKQIESLVDAIEEGNGVRPSTLAIVAEMMARDPSFQTFSKSNSLRDLLIVFWTLKFNNPRIAMHKQTAFIVLKEFLPAASDGIRAAVCSYEQLYKASCYKTNKEFDELINILDIDVRIITSIELPDNASYYQFAKNGRLFRLTHDYIVPSLRNFLMQNQIASRRGRAELLLEDLSQVWSSQSRRVMPGFLDTVKILLYTEKRNRTRQQLEVVASAFRFHAIRILVGVAIIIGIVCYLL